METHRRVVLGLAVVVGVVLAVVGFGLPMAVVAQEDGTGASDNVSFGTQVASFMQSTATDANHSVDRGMWRQSVEESTDPSAVVEARTERLQDRLDAIEQRTAALSDDGDGSAPAELVYTARASAVRVELANVRQSIDETADVAQRHGVDAARLAELRERAGNMSGPAVAAAARTLTDTGPPEWATGGGSDGEPGPSEDSPGADRGNESAGGAGDGGPPDDPGDGGPPDDGGDGGSAGGPGARGG